MSATKKEPGPKPESPAPRHWLRVTFDWWWRGVCSTSETPAGILYVLGGALVFVLIALPVLVFLSSPILVMLGVWWKMWLHLASVVSNF